MLVDEKWSKGLRAVIRRLRYANESPTKTRHPPPYCPIAHSSPYLSQRMLPGGSAQNVA